MCVQTPIIALMTMIYSSFINQQNSVSVPNIDYCSECGKPPPYSFLIIGGKNAGKDEFASYARLKIDGGYSLCGGTLISSEIIITAAHCIVRARSVEAVLGGYYRTNATKILVHPNYIPTPQIIYDVGLIRVDRVHFTDTIYPSCIPPDNSKTYAAVAVCHGRSI